MLKKPATQPKAAMIVFTEAAQPARSSEGHCFPFGDEEDSYKKTTAVPKKAVACTVSRTQYPVI
jgi:hypothetical protein